MTLARSLGEFIGDIRSGFDSKVSPVAEYDMLNPSFDRDRRTPIAENGTQEQWSLSPYNRIQAIANGRDLHQNYAPVKSVLRSFKTHIYGRGPKLHLKTDNTEWNTAAANWFNNRWSRATSCDGAQRWTLTDMNKLSLIARMREGDIACWFDASGAMDPTRTGCLYWFEADRITKMSDGLWKRFTAGQYFAGGQKLTPEDFGVASDDVCQVQGVILHKRSRRHIAYVISSKYGQPEVSESDKFSILPATDVTLVSHPFRISDTRGTSDLLGAQADFEDGREIKSNLKLRTKNQAALAMVVKTVGAVKKALSRRSSTTQPDVDSADAAPTNYENLEKVCNGRIEYIGPDDEISAFQLAGDSKDVLDLLDRNDAWSTAAIGMPDQYTRMQAEASYSDARAITNMAAAEFEVVQQFEEDHVLDWQAVRAIKWAISTGALGAGPDGWEYSIIWLKWPVPRAIDPEKEAKTNALLLATGQTTYEQLFGPDWIALFNQREVEMKDEFKRSLKIKDSFGPLPTPTAPARPAPTARTK